MWLRACAVWAVPVQDVVAVLLVLHFGTSFFTFAMGKKNVIASPACSVKYKSWIAPHRRYTYLFLGRTAWPSKWFHRFSDGKSWSLEDIRMVAEWQDPSSGGLFASASFDFETLLASLAFSDPWMDGWMDGDHARDS